MNSMKPKTKNNLTNKAERRKLPGWAGFALVILMALMLCLTINYRSYAVMSSEVRENSQLTTKIQSVTDENLELQEEIHNLKSDPATIKREAERLGIARREKVSVPVK